MSFVPIRCSVGAVLLCALLCVCVACAGGNAQVKEGSSGETKTNHGSGEKGEETVEGKEGSSNASQGNTGAMAPLFATQKSSGRVTHLSWSDNGEVLVGYADSHVLVAQPSAQKAKVIGVLNEEHEVVAVSPGMGFVLLRANPALLLHTSDEKLLMRMNQVGDVESATFDRNLGSFFIAEANGKVHSWKGRNKLERMPQETLTQFLARHTPDFTATIAPIRGPMVAVDDALFFGDDTGKIYKWDINGTRQANVIVKLRGPVRSLSMVGNYVVATSTDGQLGVATINPASFERWSLQREAQLAATSQQNDEFFVQASTGEVGLHRLENGDGVWSKGLAKGELCGLAMSHKGGQIAVCVDNTIGVIDTEKGTLTASFYREGPNGVFGP